MSDFNLLCEPVKRNVVNVLGWDKLMPLQEMAIKPLMDGEHGLLLAPTAGGKTESAMFPILSRMSNERWEPLSVIIVTPLKALLNNLEPRLRLYADWLGARVGLWHGDVSRSTKNEILADPPDLLLITSESIEVCLTSKNVDPRKLLGSVRAVIVDEIHAFAGDDRGWHLLSVIDRIQKVAAHPIQRIGLSATVGNPETILSWLTSGCSDKGRIISPPLAKVTKQPDVQIDYVQSLNNAASVISQLHVGKKRLVFCDSRSRSEKLAGVLRALGVTTYVSHSSLSAEARQQAEEAFAEASNCVIVATSTLELGIDVGGLDFVLQIDSPNTVASFLQRLGRTGRRKGTTRNFLFLATTPGALVKATAIVNQWIEGYIEPVKPPPLPFQIAAQQVMALALQQGDRSKYNWQSHIPSIICGGGISELDIKELTDHMCAVNFLDDDDRMLSLGPEAERTYSYKNYMSLFAVFNAAPMYSIYNGLTELGSVHQVTFAANADGRPITLSLAGRSWIVKSVNHKQQKAYVEPSNERATSLWLSSAPGLTFSLCQAVKSTLCGKKPPVKLSNRAIAAMDETYLDFDWISMESTTLIVNGSNAMWWTYGGAILNAAIAAKLPSSFHKVSNDSFVIKFRDIESVSSLYDAIDTILSIPVENMSPDIDEDVLDEIKFLKCIPVSLKARFINARYSCTEAWGLVKSQPVARAILE